MGIENGVVARLNAVSAVTDLTSNRIYANTLPADSARPAIVYQLISTVPFDSNLNADPGKLQSRVQLTLYADSTSQRTALSEAVRTALQRFQGSAGDITILDARLENLFDQAYDLETGDTARVADFLIYYE